MIQVCVYPRFVQRSDGMVTTKCSTTKQTKYEEIRIYAVTTYTHDAFAMGKRSIIRLLSSANMDYYHENDKNT